MFVAYLELSFKILAFVLEQQDFFGVYNTKLCIRHQFYILYVYLGIHRMWYSIFNIKSLTFTRFCTTWVISKLQLRIYIWMLRRKNSLLIFKELSLCYKASFSVVLKNSVKSNISKYYFLSKYSRLFIWPLLNVIGLSNKSIQFKEQKHFIFHRYCEMMHFG